MVNATVLTVNEYLADARYYTTPLDPVWFAKHGKSKKSYVQLYCGFDIETYTIPTNHNAYMYIWQFSLYGEKEVVVYGRTWSEFIQFIDKLRYVLDLSSERRLIIAVANLSYEFSFIKRWFKWSKIFAKEKRQPLLAVIDDCIEFRDVLAITGGSLKQLAKQYTKTQKRDGEDLDYTKARTFLTPIEGKALEYCLVDVIILAEYMDYLFHKYIIPDKFIPMTKTGLLRREVKRAMGNNYEIKQEIYRCYPKDYDFYTLLMTWVFRGGYTHGNVYHMNEIIEGIRARDITSSYPFSMFAYGGYPVSPFMRVRDPENFYSYILTGWCVVFDCIFTNIRAKTNHSYESKSKCVTISRNALIDNGRVRRAAQMHVWLTDLDFLLYQRFYEWDGDPKCTYCYIAKKGKLPKYLLMPLAHAYEQKARMKHNGLSDTSEYALYKSLVNSAYGMTVTRIAEGQVIMSQIDYKWDIDDSNFNYEEEKKKAFLLPQWGIYVTAYSRYRICNTILDIGNDAIYSDTDSIKYIGDHEDYFDRINAIIHDDMKKVCAEYDLDYDLFHDLGEFEQEYGGRAVKGKFLGAKRYIITDQGKDIVTIAGLPKNSLTNYCKKHNLNIYDVFNDNMLMDIDVSMKNAHCYNDAPHHDIIDGVPVSELSSCGIYPIEFTMKLDAYYAFLINDLKERSKRYETRIY